MAKPGYDHAAIERKWQDKWEADGTYKASEDTQKEKKYVLDMFPYPSGEGLHVGHPKGYIATDIYSRHMRMKGFNVLHPMGWDGFGLPAENYAIKNKIHPRVAVERNIKHFKDQLSHIGFDYDWSREINTTDPGYYKWTQWIFLKMLEQGLAFQSDEPINWCPSCMTGLANEDLDGANCERCGTAVEKKSLPQWVLKITDYADRLLSDLDTLAWPEHIKESQRNWIGKSEGAEIDFTIPGREEKITVFTTRPDTIFGATYLVLAPEHALLRQGFAGQELSNQKEVDAYLAAAKGRTDIERSAEKEKSGVEVKGVKAINPATGEEIPLYVADYVLGGYGTGAIMAVPAHDERDYEFAKKFDLPIKYVIEPSLVQTEGSSAFRVGEPYVDHRGVIAIVKHWSEDTYIALGWKAAPDWGTLLTGSIDEGMTPEDTVLKEIHEETGYLHAKIARSLGTIHGKYFHGPKNANRFGHASAFYVELEDGEQSAIADEEAQKHVLKWLTLPELKNFLTALSHRTAVGLYEDGFFTANGILVNSGAWNGRESEEVKKEITESVGGRMVTRYKIRDWVFSRQRYWGEPIPVIHCEKDGVVPVPYEDLPVVLPEVESYEPTGTGESPLAAITDWVNTTCPKCKGPGKRETNTMPQWAGSSWYYLRYMTPNDDKQLVSTKAEKYWAPVDVYVGGDHAVRHLIYARFWHKFLYDIGVVSTREPFARLEFLGFILAEDGRKMSKRYGNTINPDDVVAEHGADPFRIYEMFMGPFENTTAWSTASIAGTARFIDRVWQASERVEENDNEKLNVVLNQTVKKVGEDIEAFKFNTAVSQMMICMNAVDETGTIGKEQWKTFLRLLAPFAPHITEELWAELGETSSIHLAPWPEFDSAALVSALVEVVVQVGGKRRGAVSAAPDASEAEVLALAKEVPAVAAALAGKEPSRVIYVVGKILNLVV